MRHQVIAGRWTKRSLFRRGNLWYGRVRDRETGRVYEVSTRERNRNRAEQRIIDWIENRIRSEERDITCAGFEEAFQEWLDLKDIRPSTLRHY